MKKIVMFFSLMLLLSACEDDCPGDVNDFGTHYLYSVSKPILFFYKDKKFIRLKNEQGDTLRFQIQYKEEIYKWKFGDTVQDGEICTEEVIHYEQIFLKFLHNGKSHFEFSLSVVLDVWGYEKKRKNDGLVCERLYQDTASVSLALEEYIFGHGFAENEKIKLKKVKIHGIETEVIDEIANPNSQVYMHDKKGIIAMKIANHGDGFWVVDKVE